MTDKFPSQIGLPHACRTADHVPAPPTGSLEALSTGRPHHTASAKRAVPSRPSAKGSFPLCCGSNNPCQEAQPQPRLLPHDERHQEPQHDSESGSVPGLHQPRGQPALHLQLNLCNIMSGMLNPLAARSERRGRRSHGHARNVCFAPRRRLPPLFCRLLYGASLPEGNCYSDARSTSCSS